MGLNIKLPHASIGLLSLTLFAFSLACTTAKAATKMSDLNVDQLVQENGGDFTDFFEDLKQNRGFLVLCQRHNIDDPATWPELRRRFVLNLAELQETLSQAESMMAAQDRRGGLNNTVVSAEKTRAKGKEMYDRTVAQMEMLRNMLNLIDRLETVMLAVDENYSLTDEINIENTTGTGFPGKILFFDGRDIIVKRKDAGCYRVPKYVLSDATIEEVIDPVMSDWEELPALGIEDEEIEDQNAGDLIAYSDKYLYIDDRYEGMVAEKRRNSAFVFVPYEEQLENAEDELSEEAIQELNEAMETNKSRVADIEFYGSRLRPLFEVSEREEANTYRRERITFLETLAKANAETAVESEGEDASTEEEGTDDPADEAEAEVESVDDDS